MKIKTIGLVGAGTMGSGISQTCSLHGYEIIMHDVSTELMDRGLDGIRKSLARLVNKNKLSDQESDEVIDRIKTTSDINDLAKCDLVVEAASENIDLKLKIFEELNKICKDDTILASNTSSLSLTRIATASGRPEKIIGLHFFNPVPIMPLVEIIRALQTSDDTFNTINDLALNLKKTPIEVKDSPGFVVNRMLVPMINEAIFILNEGIAKAEDIDSAMKLGAAHPMGPLALADMIGLDVCLWVMDVLYRDFGDSKFRPCPLLKQMVDAGYLGRKSGRGFFEY